MAIALFVEHDLRLATDLDEVGFQMRSQGRAVKNGAQPRRRHAQVSMDLGVKR